MRNPIAVPVCKLSVYLAISSQFITRTICAAAEDRKNQ